MDFESISLVKSTRKGVSSFTFRFSIKNRHFAKRFSAEKVRVNPLTVAFPVVTLCMVSMTIFETSQWWWYQIGKKSSLPQKWGGGWKLQKIIWKSFDPLVLLLWKLSNLWPWAFAQLGVWNAWCKRTLVFFHVYILRDTRTPDYNFCWKWGGNASLKISNGSKSPSINRQTIRFASFWVLITQILMKDVRGTVNLVGVFNVRSVSKLL